MANNNDNKYLTVSAAPFFGDPADDNKTNKRTISIDGINYNIAEILVSKKKNESDDEPIDFNKLKVEFKDEDGKEVGKIYYNNEELILDPPEFESLTIEYLATDTDNVDSVTIDEEEVSAEDGANSTLQFTVTETLLTGNNGYFKSSDKNTTIEGTATILLPQSQIYSETSFASGGDTILLKGSEDNLSGIALAQSGEQTAEIYFDKTGIVKSGVKYQLEKNTGVETKTTYLNSVEVPTADKGRVFTVDLNKSGSSTEENRVDVNFIDADMTLSFCYDADGALWIE